MKYIIRLKRVSEQYVTLYVDGSDIRDAAEEAELLTESGDYEWRDGTRVADIEVVSITDAREYNS